MEPLTFISENKSLRKRMEASMNEPHKNRKVIFDGPVNATRYLQSPIKVVWMLKEAYEEGQSTGGGWSFTGAFDKEGLYQSDFKKRHRATWHPIIYTSFGILNSFIYWDDMDYVSKEPKMCDIVRDIAIINAQKLPALHQTSSYHKEISAAYNRHSSLLHEQISLLNPDVLIFSSTFHIYRKGLGLANVQPFLKSSCDSYTKDGKLYIDAYHPAQRTVERSRYVDDIIEAVRVWQCNKTEDSQPI